MLHIRRGKDKVALKTLYQAQKIVSELSENHIRNFDYIVPINCLTAFILMKIEKPNEALEFISISEKAVTHIINKKVPEMTTTP